MSKGWAVSWYHCGFGRRFQDFTTEHNARQFAQVTALLSDCEDVRVISPHEPRLDLPTSLPLSSEPDNVVRLDAVREARKTG